MPSTTLQAARRALASSFDDLSVYVLSGSTASTVTAPALVNATANASASRFDGAYAYVTGTGEQRRVRTGGYNPAAGTLTIAPDLGAPGFGSQLEITRLLPVKAQVPGEDQSWDECIRRAAAKLLVPDRIPVPITTTEQYDLSPYPWLDRPERLLGVLEPPAAGFTQVRSDWRGWRLTLYAGAPALDVRAPFPSLGGNLVLEVLRPADTFISGSEAAPGTGPTIDAQTVTAGIEELVVLGTLEACTALMHRAPGRPGQWEGQYKEARERAEALFHFDGAFYAPRRAATTGEAA